VCQITSVIMTHSFTAQHPLVANQCALLLLFEILRVSDLSP